MEGWLESGMVGDAGYDWRVWVMVWFGWGYGMGMGMYIKKAPGTFVSGAEGAATYSPACAVPSA